MKIQTYSKTKLISLLKDWERKYGEPPTKRQWNADASTPSDMPFRVEFGSWGRALKAAGFEVSGPTPPQIGRKLGSRNKKRKRIINFHGYVERFEPEHPLSKRNGYVMEHRMVAWDAGLLKNQEMLVHHVNGDKQDNRIENLEVTFNAEHTRMHKKGSKMPPWTSERRKKVSERMIGNKNWIRKKNIHENPELLESGK